MARGLPTKASWKIERVAYEQLIRDISLIREEANKLEIEVNPRRDLQS